MNSKSFLSVSVHFKRMLMIIFAAAGINICLQFISAVIGAAVPSTLRWAIVKELMSIGLNAAIAPYLTYGLLMVPEFVLLAFVAFFVAVSNHGCAKALAYSFVLIYPFCHLAFSMIVYHYLGFSLGDQLVRETATAMTGMCVGGAGYRLGTCLKKVNQ